MTPVDVSEAGRKGGLARTEKQRAAQAKNLAKGRKGYSLEEDLAVLAGQIPEGRSEAGCKARKDRLLAALRAIGWSGEGDVMTRRFLQDAREAMVVRKSPPKGETP